MKIGKILFFTGLFISWAFIVALFIAGFLMIGSTNSNSNTNSNPNNIKSNSSSLNTNSNSNLNNQVDLTLAEVSKHNTLADCWMMINNKVYDITPYSSSHPGGQGTIDMGCGKDATSLYDTKAGQGNTHSANANSLLANYYIGDLNAKISSNELQNKTAAIANTSSTTQTRTRDSEYEDD